MCVIFKQQILIILLIYIFTLDLLIGGQFS